MKMFRWSYVLPKLPSLLFQRRMRFDFEYLPHQVRGLAARKVRNFLIAGLNQVFLPARPLGYPVIAQVEPVNFCNLSCPLCLTTSATQSRPPRILRFPVFRSFMDEIGEYLLLMVLWNWGEPFLNPEIFRMIAYAKSKGVVVHSSTNANIPWSEDEVEALVDSGLDSLVIAVDGASSETYREYRIGGNLELVWRNVELLVRMKKRKKSLTPRLNVRFVVMRHNEHELDRVRERAREQEVDYFSIKSVDLPSDRGTDLDRVHIPRNEEYHRYEYVRGSFERKPRTFTCMRPWKRITLQAGGEIVACEYDYRNECSFGTIGEASSASTVWKGDRSAEFRRNFHLGNNGFPFCVTCPYKNMVQESCILERMFLTHSGPGPAGGRSTPSEVTAGA